MEPENEKQDQPLISSLLDYAREARLILKQLNEKYPNNFQVQKKIIQGAAWRISKLI